MKNLKRKTNYRTFFNFAKNDTNMSTVTVKINSTTKRGQHILGLLREMAKTGKDIELEQTPNQTTVRAMKDAEAGKTRKAKTVNELFDTI